MSRIITSPFGGNGGEEFPVTYVRELGLRTDALVDQIRINGKAHGRDGGKDRGSITLNENEYISKVTGRCGSKIDQVIFETDSGGVFGGGGKGGKEFSLEEIRVIGIGGKAGKYVDKLNIMYISDYKASTVKKTNIGFILSFSPPFQKFEEYQSALYKTMDSYEKITESMSSQKISASVEGEYYVKVSASTEIQFSQTSTEKIAQKLESELLKGSKTTQEIKKGYVGVKMVNGTLMKGENDEYWMFPTAQVSYSVVKLSEADSFRNHYDLTGELYTQMPGLKQYKVEKNGYIFYK